MKKVPPEGVVRSSSGSSRSRRLARRGGRGAGVYRMERTSSWSGTDASRSLHPQSGWLARRLGGDRITAREGGGKRLTRYYRRLDQSATAHGLGVRTGQYRAPGPF